MVPANTPPAPQAAESCGSPRTPNPELKRLISLIWVCLACCRVAQEVGLGCFLLPFSEPHLLRYCSPPSGCSPGTLCHPRTPWTARPPAQPGARGKSGVWPFQMTISPKGGYQPNQTAKDVKRNKTAMFRSKEGDVKHFRGKFFMFSYSLYNILVLIGVWVLQSQYFQGLSLYFNLFC